MDRSKRKRNDWESPADEWPLADEVQQLMIKKLKRQAADLKIPNESGKPSLIP
jgi:hypothetical protein